MAQVGLISSVLLLLYVNEMLSTSHELPLYADDTAVIATSRKVTLPVNNMEAILNDLQI